MALPWLALVLLSWFAEAAAAGSLSHLRGSNLGFLRTNRSRAAYDTLGDVTLSSVSAALDAAVAKVSAGFHQTMADLTAGDEGCRSLWEESTARAEERKAHLIRITNSKITAFAHMEQKRLQQNSLRVTEVQTHQGHNSAVEQRTSATISYLDKYYLKVQQQKTLVTVLDMFRLKYSGLTNQSDKEGHASDMILGMFTSMLESTHYHVLAEAKTYRQDDANYLAVVQSQMDALNQIDEEFEVINEAKLVDQARLRDASKEYELYDKTHHEEHRLDNGQLTHICGGLHGLAAERASESNVTMEFIETHTVEADHIMQEAVVLTTTTTTREVTTTPNSSDTASSDPPASFMQVRMRQDESGSRKEKATLIRNSSKSMAHQAAANASANHLARRKALTKKLAAIRMTKSSVSAHAARRSPPPPNLASAMAIALCPPDFSTSMPLQALQKCMEDRVKEASASQDSTHMAVHPARTFPASIFTALSSALGMEQEQAWQPEEDVSILQQGINDCATDLTTVTNRIMKTRLDVRVAREMSRLYNSRVMAISASQPIAQQLKDIENASSQTLAATVARLPGLKHKWEAEVGNASIMLSAVEADVASYIANASALRDQENYHVVRSLPGVLRQLQGKIVTLRNEVDGTIDRLRSDGRALHLIYWDNEVLLKALLFKYGNSHAHFTNESAKSNVTVVDEEGIERGLLAEREVTLAQCTVLMQNATDVFESAEMDERVDAALGKLGKLYTEHEAR